MLPAMMRAARAFYLLTIVILAIALLIPALGWIERLDQVWGEGRAVKIAIGLALLGVFSEHLLGAVTRYRQSALAQALLRMKPTLRHKEATEILIRALESDDQDVSQSAHQELQRITQRDFPADPEVWRSWLRSEEKTVTG